MSLVRLLKEHPALLASIGLGGAAAGHAENDETGGAILGGSLGAAASEIGDTLKHSKDSKIMEAINKASLFDELPLAAARTPNLSRLLKFGAAGAGAGALAAYINKQRNKEMPNGT